MTAPLRLGTRRSALAMAQSRIVGDALAAASGRTVELVQISTAGDESSRPLTQIGGTGVFVSALREAVLSGAADLAVHSLKDLPVGPADGLVLAAVPVREDPRDALVSQGGVGLVALPPGARVGTGSPRRACQMLAARPDLQVVDVRGNVDTRIGLVRDGSLDAVVLAAAGLVRLGLLGEAAQVFEPELMVPAPGQGALAVECLAGTDVAQMLAALDDAQTRCAVTAERALLAALEAGCSAPVGALAVPDSSPPNRSLLHTAVPDTAVPDTAVPDTAVPDTAVPDTAVPDTAVPDTAVPDTAVPDTAVPAAGAGASDAQWGGWLRLTAAVGQSSGPPVRLSLSGPASAPDQLGLRLAQDVLAELSDPAMGARVL